MNINSNQIGFTTKTASYPAVRIPSGTAINTDTLIVSGDVNSSIITDILVRSVSGSNTLFDVFIGSTSIPENNRVQVSINSNVGNNGSTAIYSLAASVPTLFDLDMAGNRYMQLEDTTVSIYLRNKAVLAGDFYVTVKKKSF